MHGALQMMPIGQGQVRAQQATVVVVRRSQPVFGLAILHTTQHLQIAVLEAAVQKPLPGVGVQATATGIPGIGAQLTVADTQCPALAQAGIYTDGRATAVTDVAVVAVTPALVGFAVQPCHPYGGRSVGQHRQPDTGHQQNSSAQRGKTNRGHNRASFLNEPRINSKKLYDWQLY
ncbi:hypothetical protein D3C77_577470 [compost metagenome]